MADEPTQSGGPTDASAPAAPQIRTYAKDVARLTGKPLPVSVKNEPAPIRPPAEPPPATIIPKAPTTDEKRDEVLARLKAKAQPGAPAETTPAAMAIPNAPSTEEKREDVLARLKASTGGSGAAPVTPAPASSILPPPVARAAAPLPEFVAPQRAETPPGLPPVSKTLSGPSPIHTYKTDFSDRTKEENASPISVLAAQQDAGGVRQPVALKPRKGNRLFIGAAVILIIAGGVSVFFAYRVITGRPAVPVAAFIPSLIFADEHDELTGGSAELTDGLIALESRNLPEGGVAIAYLTIASTTKDGTTRIPAQGGALIAALGLPAPELLLRNVGEESTVGVVNAGGEARPFFILKVSSFERTFAAMLSWEPTMPEDLIHFYPPYPEAPAAPVATASASSTAAGTTSVPALLAKPIPAAPSFIDTVVDNHDARALKDAQGRTLLIYGYRDQQTLLIARNEAAFKELLSRLSSTESQ